MVDEYAKPVALTMLALLMLLSLGIVIGVQCGALRNPLAVESNAGPSSKEHRLFF